VCGNSSDAQRAVEAGTLATGSAGATGTSAHHEETVLACLARSATQLTSGCRSELQALVKLSLKHYRVGMPLTSQCDGDVMARCQVDKVRGRTGMAGER
jgi:hypothetical protein